MNSKIDKQLHLMNLVQSTAEQFINFLSCLNNSAKEVWEQKRNIIETFYIVTVGNISESFYSEIADCDAQWSEWGKLLSLSDFPSVKQARLEFLKKHPTLPIDTRHFSTDFTERLLSSFDNLDAITDGLLIHSENWQALNFLQEKYREKIKCIYIDPPYNTGNDGFLYRDNYQHSTWLAMMADRLLQARRLISNDGVIFISNDENEYSRLQLLLNTVFGSQNFIENLIWRKKSGGGQTDEYFVTEHDYITCYARQKEVFKLREKTIAKSSEGYLLYDKKKDKWYKRVKLAKWGAGAHKEDRPTMYFPLKAPDNREVYPIAPDGKPGRWRYSAAKISEMLEKDKIEFVYKDGVWIAYEKVYKPDEGAVSVIKERSILYDLVENASGSNELKALFGVKDVFLNPKPCDLISYLLILSIGTEDFTLDFFAGSGTTGHAVINLNRKDGGQRKFILVEVAHYFDTVLLPRIKKISFTPSWKDGKPTRVATEKEAQHSPRIIKVIRLESFANSWL